MSEIEEVKSISAGEFAELKREDVTVIDLREPAEVLVHPLEGAVNVPFSRISTGLSQIPKEKPVYVICRAGELSEEVAEILQDRGYEAYHVAGGVKAYEEFASASAPEDAGVSEEPQETAPDPEPVYIDARALKCPGPIVKVADAIETLREGDRVHVEATEDAFYSDIQIWCQRTGNRLLKLTRSGGLISADIEKKTAQANAAGATGQQANVSAGNDKTFVVFDNDLDKTIAAFIMANGSAAMGRNVTMFFTFWGLNILRRPEKVNVKKTFIEKAFGFMMPRGTKRLKLSQMNMFGAGPKMIRTIMKQKGVSSVEELIQSAIDHGVKLVACQMSMDIMGIKKEELIDGVELGGVATFLGSAEVSDMSLFI